MNWQLQLNVITKSASGLTSREIPTFILPDLLGLMTAQDAINAVRDMFKGEIHGTVMDPDCNTESFVVGVA